MKCVDCPYYFAPCDKFGFPVDLPYCHYIWNDFCAPCEVAEEKKPLNDDYYGDDDKKFLLGEFL